MNAPPLPIPQVVHWPGPPSRWSVSSLRTAEICPLRSAFSRATFDDGSRGFPERPSEAALQGQVVHGAVDEILSALAAAGCHTVDSQEAARVVLDLGGVSVVVARHVEAVLAGLPSHPRALRVAPALGRALRHAAPSMRDRVGPFVRRARLRPRGAAEPPTASVVLPASGAREPLGVGSHTEVWVECQDPPFGGRVDILSVGPNTVDIADVKTGRPSDAHADQLVTYGILWLRDRDRNPQSLPPTSLSILYPAETTAVPLPDWDAAADALALRATVASGALAQDPVPARPSQTACRWCPARPACGAYWESSLATSSGAPFVDVDVELIREEAPNLWAAAVVHSPLDLSLVGPIVLLARHVDSLVAGQRLRLLGAHLQEADPDHPGVLLSTSSATETFSARDSSLR